MKMIITVALAFVALAAAAPAAAPATTQQEPIKIVRYQFEQQPEGSYVLVFETENGIVRNEKGELKEVLDEDKKPVKVIVVSGSYSYPGENGESESINYTGDETGYHPEGKSIPKVQSPAARR